MVTGPTSVLQSLRTSGTGSSLLVTVSRAADRLSQRVLWAVPGRSAWVIAESCEDPAAGHWPLSPPYQQIDQCQCADGRAGLVAIGMAGSSHWSVAIEASDDRLWWDVACRLHHPPDFLGSTYQLRDLGDWECNASQLVCTRYLADGEATRLALVWHAETTEIDWDPRAGRVEIRPLASPDDGPATVRWKYGFQLLGSAAIGLSPA